MDMMEVRRRVMLSMASGKLPEGVSVVEFEVTEIGTLHTIHHGLSVIPKTFMIVPVIDIYELGTSWVINPLAITGFCLDSTGNADYPYKLLLNFKNTSGKWDYTATNLGWNADQNNIYIKLSNGSSMNIGKYILFAKAYPST